MSNIKSMADYTAWAITHPWHVTGIEPRPAVPSNCDCEGCSGRYEVKCDECKACMYRTNDVRVSYAGGLCGTCSDIIQRQIERTRKRMGYAS